MSTRPHILIVDDEASVRGLIALVLRDKGYHVQEAENATAALECLRREHYDLVLTDLKMPGMDGLGLLAAAKPLAPDTDFVVLTGYGTIQSAVSAMQMGALDYLTKPLDIGELERKVASYLRQRQARQEADRSPVEPLVALHRLLARTTDPSEALDEIMALIQRVFAPSATRLRVLEESASDDEIAIRSGEPLDEHLCPKLSREELGVLALRGEPWVGGDQSPGGETTRGALSVIVPLASGDEIVGDLTLLRQPPAAPFRKLDVQLLQVFGHQIGLSLLHAKAHQRLWDTFRDLERLSLSAVESLVEALGTYDAETRDHSRRISRYARRLGERLGLPEAQLETIEIAGLLHDIGKLGVGLQPLHKNSSLSDAEFDRVRLHPAMGAHILGGLEVLAEIVPLVRGHHEHYDGQGYPDGLRGEAIPLGARILAVVDAYDSMTTDRPYRAALPPAEALARLHVAAGEQFDPRLVDLWVEIASSEMGHRERAERPNEATHEIS